MIIKWEANAELQRDKNASERNDRGTAPALYSQVFNTLSMKWGLIFNEEKIRVSEESRKKLLDSLQFRHAGTTKILAAAAKKIGKNGTREYKHAKL